MTLMTITYIPPNVDNSEPVYLYDNPINHPIQFSGIYIRQKGVARIRMVVATPRDLDRLCKVPVLVEDSNTDYRTAWSGGGMNRFQRMVDLPNLNKISTWWAGAATVSPNTPLIWVPADLPFVDDVHNQTRGSTQLSVQPNIWCVQQCACGRDSSQYAGQPAALFFDYCRGCDWNGRPALIIDGQHRIRGMAVPNASNTQDEPLFSSMLSQAAPDGVNLTMAARLFVEINAGAVALDDLHEDYLTSHFAIIGFTNARQRAAYQVGVDLNEPAALNEWAEDTGGRPGRIRLMPATWNVDYLTVERIRRWIMGEDNGGFQCVGGSYAIPAMGGGATTRTPYSWPAVPSSLTPILVNDLILYLRAITDVWPGATGPKTATRWYTNRADRGDLQEARVLRILLNVFPSIIARLDEQGLAKNVVNMQNELRAISNITFSGGWDTYLTGDSGINRASNIILELFRTTSYPTGATVWPITTWYGDVHEAITVTNFTATTTELEFCTETVCGPEPSITTPVSLLGLGECMVTIENTSTGDSVTRSIKLRSTGANTVVTYSSIGLPTPTTGNVIEMELSVATKWNPNLTVAPTVSFTVP